ncbi:hypothetical protein SAMN05216359_10180 [Roseateles sp. YR242]|uniref:hypothetical protein n=1 Tax=Roseateles sp. YR242 TaxID=1855305 RepID=UPI0008C8F302|nr:hypothetical protein [Roseateles sp. YR242]SEK22557.1 hypothetical protein SAMN05216359_10180 [Roseateles sp. YR242]
MTNDAASVLLEFPAATGRYVPADAGLAWQPVHPAPAQITLALQPSHAAIANLHRVAPEPGPSVSGLTILAFQPCSGRVLQQTRLPATAPARWRLDRHTGSTVVALVDSPLPTDCRPASRQMATPAAPMEQLLTPLSSLADPPDVPRLRISAWPALQQALHWRRDPPQRSVPAGAALPCAASQAHRERDGHADDHPAGLSLSGRFADLDQQLQRGWVRLGEVWRQHGLQDIDIQSCPRVLTGAGSLIWGYAFAPLEAAAEAHARRVADQPPAMRWWARWSLLPWQPDMHARARLTIGDAQVWLTWSPRPWSSSSSDGDGDDGMAQGRVPWTLDQGGCVPVAPGHTLSAISVQTFSDLQWTPVAAGSGAVLTIAQAPQAPALPLKARFGLRQEGAGLALFAQASCGPLTLCLRVRHPWQGEQWRQLHLPEVQLLDWSLDG